MLVQGDMLRDLPEWSLQFTENFEDEGVLASRDTPASTSHDSDSDRRTKVVSRKHSIFTRFQKDRNSEVCKRIKNTRAPCRKRTGEAVPRAENFGQITKFWMKVVNLETITVTQSWYKIQLLNGCNKIRAKAHPLPKQTDKPKVIYSDNSLEFGKVCEELSWKHCTSTPHYSETNGIVERAVRRVKEGTSAVLWQSDLDEKLWPDSMECDCYLRNVRELLSDGKTLYERRFGEPFLRTSDSVWPHGRISSYFCERPVKTPSILVIKCYLE